MNSRNILPIEKYCNCAYLRKLIGISIEIRAKPFNDYVDLDTEDTIESHADIYLETEKFHIFIEQKSRAVALDDLVDKQKYVDKVSDYYKARKQIKFSVENRKENIHTTKKKLITIIISEYPLRTMEFANCENLSIKNLPFQTITCSYAEITNLLLSDSIDELLEKVWVKEDSFTNLPGPPSDVFELKKKVLNLLQSRTKI